MSNIIKKIAKKIPKPIKDVLTRLGVEDLLSRFLHDKVESELEFQKEWSVLFSANKNLVLECWQKYRHFDEIMSICNITDESVVLDVGCGISSVLNFVGGKRFGIDPLMDEYVKLYDYPTGMDVRKCYGEKIDFPDETFDVVFCTNVLDHVDKPDATLAEISRVLKRDGHFVFTVEVFPEKVKRTQSHPHCFIPSDVDAVVASRFKTVFSKQSPWFGLRNYVNGKRQSDEQEMIMVLEKA